MPSNLATQRLISSFYRAINRSRHHHHIHSHNNVYPNLKLPHQGSIRRNRQLLIHPPSLHVLDICLRDPVLARKVLGPLMGQCCLCGHLSPSRLVDMIGARQHLSVQAIAILVTSSNLLSSNHNNQAGANNRSRISKSHTSHQLSHNNDNLSTRGSPQTRNNRIPAAIRVQARCRVRHPIPPEHQQHSDHLCLPSLNLRSSLKQ